MILIKALREIAFAIGVFIVAVVVGNIIWMAATDFVFKSADNSREATTGFAVLFAILVLIVHIVRRIMKSRKRVSPAAG
jgi:uncharacterized protein HemY